MDFRSVCRRLRRSYPDPPKTELTDAGEFVAYIATLQSATSLKCADIDIHASCITELLNEGNELQTASRYTRPFAQGLAGNTGLIDLSIHVIPTTATQDDHDHGRQQLPSVLAESAILAEFIVLFKLKNLETLTLVGLTFIMRDAPNNISLPKLRSLTLDGVSFESRRGADALKSLIQSCDLKSLTIINAHQRSGDLALVIDCCARDKKLKHLQVLDVSNNGLSREHMNTLFEGVLTFCGKIDKLFLQGNMGFDIFAIPRLPSRSTLTLLDVSDVSFGVVEHLVKAATLAGCFPALGSIVVRQLTPEGPLAKESFDGFCEALKEKGVLNNLIIDCQGSFWSLAHYALDFNPSNMGPEEFFWNAAVSWMEVLGESLAKNKTNGSLIKFYLAGVSNCQSLYEAKNPLTFRIPKIPRILELAPTPEELALILAEA
ncbi:hypothetical protein EC968_002302 [Mortierella alpina]|nr:hypothetical protein EC968_002302 [Mortierella alpina]